MSDYFQMLSLRGGGGGGGVVQRVAVRPNLELSRTSREYLRISFPKQVWAIIQAS